MIKHVVLLLELSMIHGIFDPSKIDYSKLECDNNDPYMLPINTVCTCWVSPNVVEITEDIVKFRTEVLKQHNELRNRVGNGTEKRLKSAANMNALSYDLELEYFARCVSNKIGGLEYLSECRRTSRFQKPGRNVFYDWDGNPPNISKILSPSVEDNWYNEVLNMMERRQQKINPFEAPEDHGISELFWWSNTHLGCARIVEKRTMNNRTRIYNEVVCDYGGARPSLIEKENVYEEGKGCSKCPKDVNCNSAYNGLCGEISPIPTDKPIHIAKWNEGLKNICLNTSGRFNITRNGELTIRKSKKLLFIVLITIILFLD